MSPRPRRPYRRPMGADELSAETVVSRPPGPPFEEPPPERALWPWLLLFGILVIGGLAIAWALSRGHHKPTTTVVVTRTARTPSVVGEQETAAVASLTRAGLKAAVTRRRSPRPAGIVLSEDPPA